MSSTEAYQPETYGPGRGLDPLEARHIRWCAWSIVAFLILFGVGWGILGRNIPPYPGAKPAEELAAIYREHATTMRFGFAIGAVSCTFLMTWAVGIYRLLLHINPRAQLVALLQLFGGTLTCMVPMLANVIWLAAVYRPEQDPENLRMLADLGWLVMDIVFGVTTIQYLAVGYVVLNDHRKVPIIPRWVGWVGIWIGLEFLLEIIMPQFRSGPFSWRGTFNYWIPFFAPFAWMAALTFFMFRGSRRLERETSEAASIPATA